jgi:uncharacterized protein
MINEEIIDNAISFVKEKLDGESSGHDWWHIFRVWKMAIYLAEKEGAEQFEIQLAALLHDIADWKLSTNNSNFGIDVVKDWLKLQKVEGKIVNNICEIIEALSFKGAGVPTPMRTLEGKVMQDADRLDALGAVGIARAFAYGGSRGREMHNPEIKPVIHTSFEEYKKKQSTTINHFYEKLLLLKNLMNTETAKQIALQRHQFLEQFLVQFNNEWEGKF